MSHKVQRITVPNFNVSKELYDRMYEYIRREDEKLKSQYKAELEKYQQTIEQLANSDTCKSPPSPPKRSHYYYGLSKFLEEAINHYFESGKAE